jgi:CBS domain-containing protein
LIMYQQYVEDILDPGPVPVIAPDRPIMEACRVMSDHHLQALPVIDRQGLRGIISAGAALRKCDAQGAPSEELPVKSVMLHNPLVVRAGDSLAGVLRKLQVACARHCAVLSESGHVKGVLSLEAVSGEGHLLRAH